MSNGWVTVGIVRIAIAINEIPLYEKITISTYLWSCFYP